MEKIKELVEKNELKHIAIIMDGNRRWAKERGLPSAVGHKKGVDALKTILRACNDFGVKYLTVYAFSTENWNRKPEEVNFLMDLLGQTLKNELAEMHENNVVISFIGDTTKLSDKLQEILATAVATTKENTGVNLQIAFNYGSRAEIVKAVQDIIDEGINEITEDIISDHLYTSNIPDPDLLIRTGGEMRVSNYLLWQIAYSEFVVVPEFWPDFGKDNLAECIKVFNSRNRRWGV
ncbi:MAG: isoprenyl transferase [Cyanobacteria bacterium SIG31]|nr:isoprenyl transferase [Cyanobacteria bacterium SIG31]